MEVNKMADTKISITGEKPGVKSFEDFDVFNGKGGLSRDEYKASTLHNATQTEGDAQFSLKAKLMGTEGGMLFSEEEKLETNVEKKEEAAIEP